MFDDLRDLYQEVILDHGKSPRNFRALEGATCLAHGNNPVCGDMLVVYLTLNGDGRIQDCAFQGEGCAISVASASVMTEILKGKTKTEAAELFRTFHDMCTVDDFDSAATEKFDPDAIERLQWAKDNGALLVKWLPSIQFIDPADPALEPFYRNMVALDLPLLTHAGQER